MIECPECGGRISASASKCPHCGKARRSLLGYFLLMVKALLALAALYIIASMAMCAWLVGDSASQLSGSGARPPSAARSTAPMSRECPLAQIRIKQFTPTIHDDCRASSCPALRLVGELFNGCDIAAGVQLKVTARDSQGHVVDSADAWPSSTHNIPAQSDYAFNLEGLIDYQPAMKTFEVEVVDTRVWKN